MDVQSGLQLGEMCHLLHFKNYNFYYSILIENKGLGMFHNNFQGPLSLLIHLKTNLSFKSEVTLLVFIANNEN